MDKYKIGQCWVSETEPELGSCRILKLEAKRVTVYFPVPQETRIYSTESAPLKRVKFSVGDNVRDQNQNEFSITSVREQDGLFYYSDGKTELHESDLDCDIDLNTALERLSSGETDGMERYNLRVETLDMLNMVRKARFRGLIGGRVELIPHQIYVVNEIVSHFMPRVLLADEVGLGKTIEACLIMHRLLITGQVNRILIVLPEALIHQWFVELFRRFNLRFSILDRHRCQTHDGQLDENAFNDCPLVISGINFLVSDPEITRQVISADWDMLIVDEAHHLEWTPETSGSFQYKLVEKLAASIERVILLTGTPEQLGLEGHFARLKLLDPNRYYDLEQFKEENEHYSDIAKIADRLRRNEITTAADLTLLAEISGHDDLTKEFLKKKANRDAILGRILDYHGTGRVMFRNTRHVVKGFPERQASLYKLKAPKQSLPFVDYLRHEFDVEKNGKELDFEYDYSDDPRIDWLINKIAELDDEKLLLICQTREKAGAIEQALLEKITVKLALFHEDMTLIQRDRNAAWFADPQGAQLLICSEIGSEGRNFQFAHHLVLYDLPMNPELLEQRIGRLDRIGQRDTIFIHIPYLQNSPQEVMARWYHDGLDAVEHHIPGGHEFMKPFTEEILDLAIHPHKESEISDLITRTREFRNKLVKKLENGRDHLLELNSFNPLKADELVAGIKHFDHDQGFENYALNMFEQLGIHMEPMSRRSYLLSPANCLYPLAGLPADNMTVTCSRYKALDREDISFLSWDHPLIISAMDMIISSDFGNCTFAAWQNDEFEVLLEAVFVLECHAPGSLHSDRFIPPTPVRVVVNHLLKDCSEDYSTKLFKQVLTEGHGYELSDYPDITKKLLPKMVDTCHELADDYSKPIVEKGIMEMKQHYTGNLKRLVSLQKNNKNIRDEEIEQCAHELEQLTQVLGKSKTRLDSLRLILKKP